LEKKEAIFIGEIRENQRPRIRNRTTFWELHL